MHLAIGALSPSTSGQPSMDNSNRDKAGDMANHGGGESGRGRRSKRQSKIDPKIAEAISQGIADLTEMAPCHFFAEQALNILRYLAKKWHIHVEIRRPRDKDDDQGDSKSATKNRESDEDDDEDDDDDDDDDHGNTRPLTSSLNFFSPNVTEQDFICRWGSGSQAGASVEKRAATAAIASAANTLELATNQLADAIQNPLFWPFPMQGRPMLPSGPLLREAGFELLI
jgi:hypothetical protein